MFAISLFLSLIVGSRKGKLDFGLFIRETNGNKICFVPSSENTEKIIMGRKPSKKGHSPLNSKKFIFSFFGFLCF